MAKARQLANPPIAEALLDVQFAVASPPSDEALLEFATSFLPDGWVRQDIRTFAATFGPLDDPEKQGIASASNSLQGYMLKSSDGDLTVQFRKDRITLSRTQDYVSWEKLVESFKPVFDAAVKFLHPEHVLRVATRYINRLEFSEDRPIIEDYLEAPPTVAGHPDAVFLQFSQQVVLEVDHGFLAAVTVGKAAGEVHGFIVDIDVFKRAEMAADWTTVMDSLAHARDIKNDIFFKAVSEKALEKYA